MKYHVRFGQYEYKSKLYEDVTSFIWSSLRFLSAYFSIMESHKRVALLTVSELLVLLTVLSLSTPASAQSVVCDGIKASDFGLLVNFSVPCDLPSEIAVPDAGGLLTPNLLGVGYQEYTYDGSEWIYVDQVATLYNKTLDRVGSLNGTADGGFVLEFDSTPNLTLRAAPLAEVTQMFSIALQLLEVNSSSTAIQYYGFADYIQRFGTIKGLPPAEDFPAVAGDSFQSEFAAFYAFYLPFNVSPQLATRVPRCGDERFYGLQAPRATLGPAIEPAPEPTAA